jgi:hypothetical protein
MRLSFLVERRSPRADAVACARRRLTVGPCGLSNAPRARAAGTAKTMHGAADAAFCVCYCAAGLFQPDRQRLAALRAVCKNTSSSVAMMDASGEL